MTKNLKTPVSRRNFLSISGFLPLTWIVLSTAPTFAAEPSDNKRKIWNTLTDEQKIQVIKRWQEFKSLPLARQQELREAEVRFKNLEPVQQERIRHNLLAWNQMAPAEKEKVRANFSKWQNLSPAEKSSVDERYRKWKSLPEEKREKIRRELRREK